MRVFGEIRRCRDAGKEMKQNSIAEEAFTEQKLTFMASQPTISRLLKMRINFQDSEIPLNPSKKTRTAGMHPNAKKIFFCCTVDRTALSKSFHVWGCRGNRWTSSYRGALMKNSLKRKLTFCTVTLGCDSNRNKAGRCLLTLLQLPLIVVGNAMRAYCYSIASYP